MRKLRFAVLAATVSWVALTAGAAAPVSPRLLIISPPAFTNLWQSYADYRAETHPDLSIAIKSTADIYAECPDAVARGDHALAIHRYLESLHNGGAGALETVLLGAAAPGRADAGADTNWHSFTNKFLSFDPDTQIPTRYPVTVGCAAHEASDMYYACMDRTDTSAVEVWDCDGDGIYLATLAADGTMVNEPSNRVDWAADLQVMRVPLQPLIVETTGGQNSTAGEVTALITAAQQMSNFIAKLRTIESGDWHGAGEHAICGDMTLSGVADLRRGSVDRMYTGEREFFDGGINFFSPDNREYVIANEPTARHRAWQFFSGVRANGVTRHCIGLDWCLPGVYGTAPDALASLTSQSNALNAVKTADHDSIFMFSHGWARATQPVTATDLLNGDYSGVSRFYFAPEPCDTGMLDYAHKSGQTTTNGVCLGAAAVLAPGGAAVSYNNSRVGISAGLDNGFSSQLEGWLMSAVYNGNCTNTLFDVANPAVTSPITAGRALLLVRQAAADSGRYSRFDISTGCLMQLNGFGDPLMTISPSADAADDLSSALSRVLSLSRDTTVSSTNSAALLTLGANVHAISGDGNLRVNARTEIAADRLSWSVAGGMGRAVAFASPGGTLVFPGTTRRYVGRSFTNVGAIDATGSGVTIDFGASDDNASCPVGRIAFISETDGTNVIRQANRNAAFFASAIAASNTTLRVESAAPFNAALTDATLLVAPNPLWTALDWSSTVAMNASRLEIGCDGFTLSNATFRVAGGEDVLSTVTNSAAGAVTATGPVSVALAEDAMLSLDSRFSAPGGNGRLVVSGRGILRLPQLPLVGFTNLTLGSGISLIVPQKATGVYPILSGAGTQSIVFEGPPSVFPEAPDGSLDWVNNPVARGGAVYSDGASNLLPSPYTRTLASADEIWCESSAWLANGAPFGKAWSSARVDASATVVLAVANGPEAINLMVEDALSLSRLEIADAAAATAPGSLTIRAANGLFASAIDASGFSSRLALDFSLATAALTANADTHLLAGGGTGALTIPAGARATVHGSPWSGTIANSGTYRICTDEDAAFTLAGMAPGTNSYARGTCAGNLEDVAGKALLVEDGDTVSLSGEKHTIGFHVTGGSLVFSRPKSYAWMGSIGNSLPFVQTGGTTTVDTVATTLADTMKGTSKAGLLLGYTGRIWSVDEPYFVTIAGGRFEVPKGHINYWNYGTVFTVTNGGAVAAKGLSATQGRPQYEHHNKFTVAAGGRFEMGEIGVCEAAPVVTVNGGTLLATATTSIRAAVTLVDATLATASGRTLTVSVQPSASGTLTLGAAGSTGVIDIGTNRFANATLAAASCGTLAVTFTAEEMAANAAVLFAGTSVPDALAVECTLADGSTSAGRLYVAQGAVRVVPVARTLTKPIAIWNGDFREGLVRGGFRCYTQGNTLENGNVAMTAKGLILEFSSMSGTSFPGAVVAGVSNAVYSTAGIRTLLMQYISTTSGDANKSKYGFSLSADNKYLACHAANLAWNNSGIVSDLVAGGPVRYLALAHKGLSGGTQYYEDGVLKYNASGLHVSGDSTYRGYVLGGRYGIADNLCTGARVSYAAILPSSAAKDVADWSLTALQTAETPANGDTVSGGAAVGVNLDGGVVTVAGETVAAALFVQSDTTLVFEDGASLAVQGPMYIADGAVLTVRATSGSGGAWVSRTLITAKATAYDAAQVACGQLADKKGEYSVVADGGRIDLRFARTRPVAIWLR